MKIVHVLHYPGGGGAEQYIYLLAKKALADGHSVEFVFGSEGPLIERLKSLGVRTHYIAMPAFYNPVAIWKLSRYFKTTRPDVVHTHFLRENFLCIAAGKLAGVKGIFSTVHRLESKNPLQAWFNKIYSRGLTGFIAVSEEAKEMLLKEGISEKSIVVIPNGVEIMPYDKKKVRDQLGLEQGEIVIVNVGRFGPEKGQELLTAAVAGLRNSSVRLVLVGDGPELNRIKMMAEDLGIEDQVVFTGARDNGFEIIGVADLYVQPSLIEVSPLSVLEALSQGVPVVASDIPAHRHVLKSGEIGDLFVSGQVASLELEIRKFLENSQKLEEKAKKAFLQADQFSADRMWQETKEYYNKTLK